MFRYLAAVVTVALASQYATLGLPMARGGHLRPGTARRLAASRWGHVWVELAGNPRIPADVARSLLTGGENVQRALAGNPAIPPDVRAALARASDAVRADLAANPALPPDMQRSLLRGAPPLVRMGLAGNPALPLDLQELLVDDEWDAVVVNLAGNPGLAPRIQEALADTAGAGWRITLALVQRRNLSPTALRLLLAGPRYPATVVALGERSDCGPSRRWRARDLDTGVRGAAIAARATDPRLVERAAVHRDPLIRVAATANSHLPAEALRRLMDDCDTEVRLAAQQRLLDTLVAVR